MLEESILDKHKITELLLQVYGIKVTEIKRINRGSACLFEIYSDDNHYVLKEFQKKYSIKEIKKEIDIINHLYQDGLSVPVYVKSKNGEYSFMYNNKIIILQEFIDGYIIEQNGGNYEQTIESAKLLGLIVKSLEDFPYELPSGKIDDWYSLETFENSIKKHNELIEVCSDDEIGRLIKNKLKAKIKMIDKIKNKFNIEEIRKITCMNTHGDYSIMQFIYKDDKINAVIDFVAASSMPIIWEIARSYSYIDSQCKDGIFDMNNFINYVKEFNKYVKLNKYDLTYMPYLYMFQLLTSTYGFKQYIYDNSKKELLEFGFLRFNMCKFLYENADEISQRLNEEVN